MISRKLDGVRTIAINNHGKIEFYSRQGERFHTLEVLAEQVLKIMERLPDLCVFDGEVCIIDENGQDNFAAIMKQITRKNHQIKDLNYVLFDLIDQRDFYFKKGTTSFRERLKNLTSLKIESKIISIVEHECDINQKQFDE
jgi:ATP-dependent DNA ligase